MNINPNTNQPITLRQIRALHPDTAIGPNADLVALGYPEVEPTAQPTLAENEYATCGDPEEYEPGKWRETWVVNTRVEPVPHSVDKRQLYLRLYDEGVTETDVETILGGIADPIARDKALIELKFASAIERDNPLVAVVASAQSWDEATVDQMFREASQL
jgi:hypothetical protein